MGAGDGSGAAVGSSGMRPTVPVYLPAACSFWLEGRGGGGAGSGPVGNETGDTPGVPSREASQGRPATNARAANGQSCLPGCVTTAQSIPFALPVAHNEFAAAVWSLGLAAAFTTIGCGRDDGVPLMANHPATPLYCPWRVITVIGSNAAYAAALPPNSRAMVWALLPELGVKSPAMSSNALNMSGCITVRSTAQVPPIDHPTTPQLARFVDTR